jgi:hypothetical protein
VLLHTQNSCFHDATARHVRGLNDLEEHSATAVARSHTPWLLFVGGAMKGAVYKDNPYTLLELKEAIANFARNIPQIELSRVFANKIRRILIVCILNRHTIQLEQLYISV